MGVKESLSVVVVLVQGPVAVVGVVVCRDDLGDSPSVDDDDDIVFPLRGY
jgi:hypothetical protein